MLTAGLDRQALDWSGSVQWRHASQRFSQQGQPDGRGPRTQLTVALGTSWRGHTLGASLVDQRGGRFDSRLAQVNYGRDLDGWGQLGLIVLRDLRAAGGGTSLGLQWSMALDARHGLSVGVQRQRKLQGGHEALLQAQLQRNPAFGSGLGYQLVAGSNGQQMAQAQWQGEQFVLNGGVARRGSDTELRAGASGGVAWVDGSVFAGRRIEGGIAVVDVAGHEGVRVMQDNQVVARTDARGRAFVAGLRGYQPNRVGIDASDLPLGVELHALEIQLTPAARSAARIEFPVQRGRSATLQILDLMGRPLPPGSALVLPGAARHFAVGFNGRAYVAGMAAGRSRVQAVWPGGRCEFELELPPASGDDLPDLGLLICR